jgi:predicted CXXCH cytochrome family protein
MRLVRAGVCGPGLRHAAAGAPRTALAALPLLLAAVLVVGLAGGAAQAAERTPLPVIEKASQGEACVAPADVMRRRHMDDLKHQRDQTVRGGVRGAKYSLKDCIACHASTQTGSVAAAGTNFCVSCHQYAAVKIDCFECHSTRPAGPAHAVAPGGKPK